MRHYLLLISSIALALPTEAATAEAILSKLDAAASKLSGMTADLTRITYTKVLDEKAEESGQISLKKQGREMQVLINFSKPDAKVVGFRGRKAEIYYPKLKTVQEWDLGKHGALIDQFLLVGFGSGKDLKSAYTVKYAGEETVGGVKAHKLELTPTAPEVKEKLRRVELWVSDDGTLPIQQRFIEPSGNYYMATYSNVKLNPALTEDALRLTLPKGVKREYPQK
jgi:outer membrane lipoprotein-sorting protein